LHTLSSRDYTLKRTAEDVFHSETDYEKPKQKNMYQPIYRKTIRNHIRCKTNDCFYSSFVRPRGVYRNAKIGRRAYGRTESTPAPVYGKNRFGSDAMFRGHVRSDGVRRQLFATAVVVG